MGKDDDPYSFVASSSLKLKRDDSNKIKKSKKSKKKKKKRDRSASPELGKGLNRIDKAPNYRFAKDLKADEANVPWNPGDVKDNKRTEPDEKPEDYRPMLTKSEMKYFEKQREREMDRILVKASKSHKERVEDFNRKLADISELHFDIPKISWTK